MVNTLNTLDKQKYLDELNYERPDAVLGDLMSDCHYALKLHKIIDPCDWLHGCNYQNYRMTSRDRQVIQSRQPMFYNAMRHREVNRQDVVEILKRL